jgi:hypothetical protein
LDLLASGNPTPELADKPHFYAARLRAAEKAASSEVKEQLLRNAVNDTPDRDAARVSLFSVLANAGKDRLAVSAMEPMLNANFLQIAELNRYRDNVGVQDDEESSSVSEDSSNDFQMESALERITPGQKAQMTYALGKSYAKLEDYSKAVQFFRNARSMETNKATRAEIDKSIASTRAILGGIATNNARVPMVRVELEQDHVVRPRVLEAAKSAPRPLPASSKAPKGGAQ